MEMEALQQQITDMRWDLGALHQQLEAALREIAVLRTALDQQDDFAGGIVRALVDVLPGLLKAHPDVAASIAPAWRAATTQWERLQTATGQADDFHETEHLLEPTKLLYRQLRTLRVWPADAAQ